MSFDGIQKTFTYKQINTGNVDDVFPLLCPFREKDWLEDWDYKMIHSNSGLVEKDCVFTTQYNEEKETVWHVTQYDKESYLIEFSRVTPGENVVRINIELKPIDNETTEANISYQYTALNEKQNSYIENGLAEQFEVSMRWWEKAINYYLATGVMLKKEQDNK